MNKAHLIIYLAVLASIVSVLITCCLLYLIRDRLSKLFSKNTLLKIKKFLKENVKDTDKPSRSEEDYFDPAYRLTAGIMHYSRGH